MTLDVKIIKKEENIYLVELKGSIDTDTHTQMEKELCGIINNKTKAVVFDMKNVAYISSIGIKVVIDAKKDLESHGASFAMINLQPQIKKIFEVLKILPMFDIFNDMPEADKYIDEIIKEEIEKEKK